MGMRHYSNEELVNLYNMSGNEAYMNKLLTQNAGLLNRWAVSYADTIPNVETEDLVSEAYFPFIQAVKDFKPNRGCNFASFLKVYVHQHFNRIYNHETRKKRFIGIIPDSYEGLLAKAEEEGYGSLGNAFTVECTDYSSVELKEFIDSLDLNDRESVVVNVLLCGGTKGEIAKTLNITPATTTYYLRKIRDKFISKGFQYAV